MHRPMRAVHYFWGVQTLVRVGVISDTHIPARGRKLPAQVFDLFEDVSLILHAGDFVDAAVLYELQTIAPVEGVLGNCDPPGLGNLPITKSLEIGGVQVAMIHDSGSRERRRAQMAAAFPGHRVVVFGHSHMPLIEDDGSLLLLNPGSACDPRAARIPSVAILEIRNGQPTARLIHLER